jgi:hypothetical protein
VWAIIECLVMNVEYWLINKKKYIGLKLLSYISLMSHTTIENEMFRMIREESKHIELWLPLKDFNNYLISSAGRIRSKRSGDIWARPTHSDFYRVNLLKRDPEGYRIEKHMVHDLVMHTFTPNPENMTKVQHIDGNKNNNNLLNLCFVDSENI